MNFFITAIYTFIKQILSSKRYIIAITIIPFIILLLCSLIPENDYNNINVGIAYSNKSSVSNRIIKIIGQDNNIKYCFYDLNSINELERDVASNKLHLGYVIPSDIDEKLQSRNFKKIIVKMESSASYLSAIIDEVICSTLIQVITPYYADNFLFESNLISYDDETRNYLIESTSNYLKDGDIMEFELFSNKGSRYSIKSNPENTKIVFACLALSLCMMSSNLLIYTFNFNRNNKLFNFYKSTKRSIYRIKLYYIIALSIISILYIFVSLFILLCFIDINEFSLYSILIMFLSIIIFIGGLCSFTSKFNYIRKIIHIILPLILFGNFIFSGFLFNTEYLGGNIDKLSYLFPSKYFLTGLYKLNINPLSMESLINPVILILAGVSMFFI
ncbi:ABC transporter permease [Sedimentibacter sp. MB31-C6]|uniref:ABC transporter permease n=1 Tax=Sedimentibacter sp. MB31-C6 TaxID=3109366 RepID=UPI002DDCE9D5|nr:ABC transporter permease [Sedimentibacter sp. MB36-C1]WSI03690.1 ABC transporter permease [Sedimentibacter sp. MB36-C1]